MYIIDFNIIAFIIKIMLGMIYVLASVDALLISIFQLVMIKFESLYSDEFNLHKMN